jgi:calcineurin-like phosphoesterase family protein
VKFRDDIDPANTWVTSDTHFGHENIVGYCARPEDHDQIILEQWRAHVPDDATVLHLGDLCWKSNGWFEHVIAPRLSGARKLLIQGNHDKGRPSWYKRCGFQIVRPFELRLVEGAAGLQVPAASEAADYIIGFDHYPGEVGYNEWRLHGHIHNNGYFDGRNTATGNALVPFLRNHINLSVEQTRYRPVNLKLLLDAAILGRLPE